MKDVQAHRDRVTGVAAINHNIVTAGWDGNINVWSKGNYRVIKRTLAGAALESSTKTLSFKAGMAPSMSGAKVTYRFIEKNTSSDGIVNVWSKGNFKFINLNNVI